MSVSLADITTKLIGDRKRGKAHKARTAALPPSHRTAIEGIERYLMVTGPGDGERLMLMLGDLLDLFEQSAADGTTVRAVVGDDPVAFAEDFRANYGLGAWLEAERERLTDAIARADGTVGRGQRV
jgi:DNA-binding ferritin-like protein (Dps family)